MWIVSLFAQIFEKKMTGRTVASLLFLLVLCLWEIWLAATEPATTAAQPAPMETTIPRHGVERK